MATEDRNGCLHGDDDGKFVSKGDNSKAYNSQDNLGELKKKIRLPDENIPKSIGAKWANEDILMPDGTTAKFVEGSKITHKEVFADKGTKTPIRDIERLVKEYPNSKAELWQKIKGRAELEWNGEQIKAEVHWYEEPNIGRVEGKSKKEL